MTPGARSALFRMAGCIGRDMASHYAQLAAEHGATVAELIEAWDAWDALQNESLQVIHSDPRPDMPCACPHTAADHDGGTGRCLSRACGCRTFRPGGRKWA